MLQKPPLKSIVNDTNSTPKPAHEKCKNIATKTENTTKQGVSADSGAPEKLQNTYDFSVTKKNQETQNTKLLQASTTKNSSVGASSLDSGQREIERSV